MSTLREAVLPSRLPKDTARPTSTIHRHPPVSRGGPRGGVPSGLEPSDCRRASPADALPERRRPKRAPNPQFTKKARASDGTPLLGPPRQTGASRHRHALQSVAEAGGEGSPAGWSQATAVEPPPTDALPERRRPKRAPDPPFTKKARASAGTPPLGTPGLTGACRSRHRGHATRSYSRRMLTRLK